MKPVTLGALDRGCPSSKRPSLWRQYVKRASNKTFRRLWRQHGEDAPTKVRFSGYAD